MENAELRQYLKDVYDLERQLYSYRIIQHEYKEKIADLEFVPQAQKVNPNGTNEWKQRDEYKQIVADFKKRKKEIKRKSRLKGLLKLLAVVGIWLLLFLLGPEIALLAIVPALAMLVGLLVGILMDSEVSDVERGKEQTIYNYFMKCYQEELNEGAKAKLPLATHLRKQLDTDVVPPMDKLQNLLIQLYNVDIIHPKYRNFLAVSQIYEYLDTGRCTELGGPNGAYNLYELEIRQNTIIDKLDQVVHQLDRLSRTMAYVASAVSQTNEIVKNISTSLVRIEANTALTAYNTQCIAYNTELANRYNYNY